MLWLPAAITIDSNSLKHWKKCIEATADHLVIY